MFMDMAHSSLAQAKGMGLDFLPDTGMGGIPEKLGQKAREWGFPQALNSKEMARQSIALAIAEPIVRAESGAAVPADEVRKLALRYVPSPGETRVEQHRKLRSLVSAIGALRQGMPEWKAAEFAPMQQNFQRWADELEGGGGKSKTVVRRGTDESGKRVVQYSDGTTGPE